MIPSGPLLAVGVGKSLGAWVTGLMSPILLMANSVNHILPSGPAAMSSGPLLAVATGYSLIACVAVVIRPIKPAFCSVNQSAPSGPVVMPASPLLAVGIGNSLMVCAAVSADQPSVMIAAATRQFTFRDELAC